MTKEEMNQKIDNYLALIHESDSASSRFRDFIWGLLLDGRDEMRCEECGQTFVKRRRDHRYCKVSCKKAAHNRSRQATEVDRR